MPKYDAVSTLETVNGVLRGERRAPSNPEPWRTGNSMHNEEAAKRAGFRGALVPAIHVTAVVPAPRGAHPTACHRRYPVDRVHVLRYIDAARGDDTFKRYLDRYVLGVRDHAGYLERIAADGP